MFREWIYIVSAIIIMFGFVAGIIQLLLKIKKKIVKVILISIFVMLFLLSTPISLLHMWMDLIELMWITIIIKIYL